MLPVTCSFAAGDAERFEPLRVLVGLHGEHRELLEHPRDEPRSRVHAERLRRHLAVDEHGRHAAVVRNADQVRPELRFGDDEQARD